eukprot:TRINITY_DN31079_c0_g1_i1.p1 TRINITY_DN31079_c0_g1~~TRINITY_DN31079_c0_g1_i1.p1  ORF type:complete len:436 (-),score=64.54 TRINITY_DN31079_c0_g1_i1:25-1164(-)
METKEACEGFPMPLKNTSWFCCWKPRHLSSSSSSCSWTGLAFLSSTLILALLFTCSLAAAAMAGIVLVGDAPRDMPWGPAECFVRPSFQEDAVHVHSNIHYGSAPSAFGGGKTDLLLDLYMPPAIAHHHAARPAAVLMHGGTFTAGSKETDSLPRWARLLAARGYVVASINYRLATAADLHNPDAVANMAQEDARAAVRYLRKNANALRVDSNRIMVGGDSAGGVIALYYGYVRNASEGQSGNPGISSEIHAVMAISGTLKSQAYCALLGADLEPKYCEVNSPPGPDYTFAIEKGVPLLQIHGTQDKVLPYVNARALASRAHTIGTRNLLVSVPDGGHVPMEQAFDPASEYLDSWLRFLSGALNLAELECPTKSGAVMT